MLSILFLPLVYIASVNAEPIFGNDSNLEETTPSTEAGDAEGSELTDEENAIISKVRTFWKREPIVKREVSPFPPMVVAPRKGELEFFPCMDCHDDDKINVAKPRVLTEEHEGIILDHGGNRFWCVTCHNLKDMNFFRGLNDAKIDFNKPYLLCGQCHAPRQADWFSGGHGKRIGNWKGKMVLLACTECHNSHSPTIKPRPPDPPPERHKGPPNEIDTLLAELKKMFE